MGLKEELKKYEEGYNPYAEALGPTVTGTLSHLVKKPGTSLLKGAEYLFEWPGAGVRGMWTSGEDELLPLLAAGAKSMGRHFAGEETPTGQEAIKAQFGKGIGEGTWWGPAIAQVITNPLDVATIPALPKDIYTGVRHLAKLRHPLKVARTIGKAAPKALEKALPTVVKPLKKFKGPREALKYLENLDEMRMDAKALAHNRAQAKRRGMPESDSVTAQDVQGVTKGKPGVTPEAFPKVMNRKQRAAFFERLRKGRLSDEERIAMIQVSDIDKHVYLTPPGGLTKDQYLYMHQLLPKTYGRYLVALDPGDLYDYYRLTDAGIGIVLPKSARKVWGSVHLPDGREVTKVPPWLQETLNRVNKHAISDLNIWVRDMKDPGIKKLFGENYPAHYTVGAKTLNVAPPEAIESEIVEKILFELKGLSEKHAHAPLRKLLGKEPTRLARRGAMMVRPKGEGLNLISPAMKNVSITTRKGWEYILAHEMGHHIVDTSIDLMKKTHVGYWQLKHAGGTHPGGTIKAYKDYTKANLKYKNINPKNVKVKKAAKLARDTVFPDDPTFVNNFEAMKEHMPMFDWTIHEYATPSEFTSNAFAQLVAHDMYQNPEFLLGFPPEIRDALRRMMSREYAIRMPIKIGKETVLPPILKGAEKEFLTIGDMPQITTEQLKTILPAPVAEGLLPTEIHMAKKWQPVMKRTTQKAWQARGDKKAKRLGQTFGMGQGIEGRKLKAVAARDSKTGKVIVGKPGQVHASLPDRAFGDEWDMGFVDNLDEFYTREEAVAAFGSGESYKVGVAKPGVVDFDALVKDRLYAMNMGDLEAVKRADYAILKEYGVDKLKEAMTSNIADRFKDAKKLITQGALSNQEKKLALKRLAADLRVAKKNMKFDIKTAKLTAEQVEIRKPDWEPPIGE